MSNAPVTAQPRADFVETPQVREITDRALGYLEAGLAVNLEGPSGTGKTTLALHVATQLGRPMVLISGDHEFGSSNLLGANNGFRRRKVVDNFIHSVLKVDEESANTWIDERLTVACKHGYTLVYDEFTRSKAEANNVLLPVLEEGLLIFPSAAGKGGYMKVHPEFRAIFTSNPEDYAGVNLAQEALRDRLVTMRLEGFDLETEAGIVSSRSGLALPEALAITTMVRLVREHSDAHRVKHSVRAALQIARVAVTRQLDVHATSTGFQQVVFDVLTGGVTDDQVRADLRASILEALHALMPERAFHAIAKGESHDHPEQKREEKRPAAVKPAALGTAAL